MPLTRLAAWMVFFSLALSGLSAHAGWLEMADLMAHPEQYDRKEVVVVGTVHHVEPAVDRQGQPAFKFLLGDGVGTLRVICRTEVQEGEQVIVEGTFSRRRQSGRLPVYSEVSANFVRPLSTLTPELVG